MSAILNISLAFTTGVKKKNFFFLFEIFPLKIARALFDLGDLVQYLGKDWEAAALYESIRNFFEIFFLFLKKIFFLVACKKFELCEELVGALAATCFYYDWG